MSHELPRREPLGQIERLLFLRSLPTFETLSVDEACAVAGGARERVFAGGAYIHRRGKPIEAVEFVIRGRVEVRRRGVPMRVLGPCSIVGALGILAEDPDGYDCVALEETVTLELSADDAEEVLEDNFELLSEVARSTAEELLHVRASLGESAGYSCRVAPSPPLPLPPLEGVARMAALRAATLFAKSRIDALGELARGARELRVPADHRLFCEGDPGGRIFVCVSGAVACERSARRQLFRFGPGDAMGVLDSIAGARRWYTAHAERELVVVELEMERVFEVLESCFDVAMPFVRALSVDLLELYDTCLGVVAAQSP